MPHEEMSRLYIYNAGNVRPLLFFSRSFQSSASSSSGPPHNFFQELPHGWTLLDADVSGGPLLSRLLFSLPSSYPYIVLYRYLFPVGVFCTPSSRRGVFRASDAFFFLNFLPKREKREAVCKFPKMTTQYITDKGEGGSSFTSTAALRAEKYRAVPATHCPFICNQTAGPAGQLSVSPLCIWAES